MADDVDAIAQLSFAVYDVLSELAAEHDLSLTQLRMLGILRDREPAMLDLARRLKLTKSSASGLIDRAEKRGLVERTPAEHDGRGVHVRLSADGRRLAEQLTEEADAAIAALLEPLPQRDRARLGTLAQAALAARHGLGDRDHGG